MKPKCTAAASITFLKLLTDVIIYIKTINTKHSREVCVTNKTGFVFKTFSGANLSCHYICMTVLRQAAAREQFPAQMWRPPALGMHKAGENILPAENFNHLIGNALKHKIHHFIRLPIA